MCTNDAQASASVLSHLSFDALLGALYFIYSGQLPFTIEVENYCATVHVAQHPYVAIEVLDGSGCILPYWEKLYRAAQVFELEILQQLLVLALSTLLLNVSACEPHQVMVLLRNTLAHEQSPSIASATTVAQLCSFYFLTAENNAAIQYMELLDPSQISVECVLEILDGLAIRSLLSSNDGAW